MKHIDKIEAALIQTFWIVAVMMLISAYFLSIGGIVHNSFEIDLIFLLLILGTLFIIIGFALYTHLKEKEVDVQT